MVRSLFFAVLIVQVFAFEVAALPPPKDIPEEILRTEIITEARSPVTGEPLTASEYAELEIELHRQPELYNTTPQNLRSLIHLLRIRRAIRTFIPFIP